MDHLSEIHEKILIRLSVRDLIRCKSVCKSWLSLITTPHFIKSHLNHSYQIDCKNDEIGNRRIIISRCFFHLDGLYHLDKYTFESECRLLGSSNGLVCVSTSRSQILILNPSTREVKRLRDPQIPKTGPLCRGFGYDSVTNDYKVVIGFLNGVYCTCFQVFSLKSNTWKVIGEVNDAFSSKLGVLCKGALHWVAYDGSSKTTVIRSFHLSDETFGEVPQPDDVSYQYRDCYQNPMRLGLMQDCLCVYSHKSLLDELWVMKEYNVKQSWEMFGCEDEVKYGILHRVRKLQHYIPNRWPLCYDSGLFESRLLVGCPSYVESLVSPHFKKRPKRKTRAIAFCDIPHDVADAISNSSIGAKV